MTPIPATYTSMGFTFKLVAREGMVAIYEQADGGRVLAYEVVRVRPRKARVIKVRGEEHHVPAHEELPGNADWGTSGWTFSLFAGRNPDALEQAMVKMRAMLKE